MSQSTHPEPLPSPQGGTPWLWLLLVVLGAAAGGADGRSDTQFNVMLDTQQIRRWRAIAATAALAGVVLLKLPVMSLPLFGDELAYYFGAAWIQEHGFFALPWWTEPYVFLSHPPGQFWLSAAVFELLGDRTWPVHTVMLTLALLTLLYTYRIAAHLADRLAGVTAALLLFSMPLFFAQSVLMLNDLPVAAFGSMAVYYTLVGRRWKYVATATLAALFKITAGAIIVPCSLYLAWQNSEGGANGRLRGAVRALMVGLLPLVPVTIYMLGQRYATGMWLPNPWMPQNEIKTMPLVPAMLLFLGGRHWLLSGALLVGLVATPRRFRRPELLLIGGMFALFIIGLTPECNLRYLMPAITLLAVLAAYALREVFGDRAKARLGATALLVATCWLPWPMLGSGNMNPPDASMRYVDVLRVRQDVMEHLLEHHQAELGVLVLSEPWHMLLPPERTIQLLDIKWLEDEAGLDFAVELPHITDASTQELQQIVARRSFQPCVRFQHGPEHGAVWCESHEANQQLTPARLERRLLQAGILTEQGRFDEALAACDRLLAEPLTPEQQVAVLQQAATVLSKDNRFEAAAERLSHALRILPNDAQMHLDLGMARLAQQDLASAATALDQAVALAPDWSHAHLQLGFVRMLQRRLPEAERHLLQAATLGDPQPDADYYLGALYVEQGDFAEAVEHLTRAAEQITDRGRLYYYLAVARGQLGEIDAAWTAIERAVALAPDDAEAAQYREQLARRRAAPASDRGE